jgi:hypothetical protein
MLVAALIPGLLAKQILNGDFASDTVHHAAEAGLTLIAAAPWRAGIVRQMMPDGGRQHARQLGVMM